MHLYHCSKCSRTFREDAVLKSHDGKALGALVGLALGSATKNPWGALGLAVVGAMAGHIVDEELAPQCPECAEVLKLVVRQYLSGGLIR